MKPWIIGCQTTEFRSGVYTSECLHEFVSLIGCYRIMKYSLCNFIPQKILFHFNRIGSVIGKNIWPNNDRSDMKMISIFPIFWKSHVTHVTRVKVCRCSRVTLWEWIIQSAAYQHCHAEYAEFYTTLQCCSNATLLPSLQRTMILPKVIDQTF